MRAKRPPSMADKKPVKIRLGDSVKGVIASLYSNIPAKGSVSVMMAMTR